MDQTVKRLATGCKTWVRRVSLCARSPGRLWSQSSLLSNDYHGVFPWGKAVEA